MKQPATPLKGLSLLVELHRWRGVRAGSDLFLRYLVLGWLTVGGSRFVMTDLMERLRVSLRAFRSSKS